MRHQHRVSVLAAAIAVATLTACGTTADTPAKTTAGAAPEQVTQTTEHVTEQAADQASNQSAAPSAGNRELPTAVTGYTDEARQEMSDEGLTDADVESVLQAALDGRAEFEWDDDGYFEIEFRDIEIDVDPQGLVRDADR